MGSLKKYDLTLISENILSLSPPISFPSIGKRVPIQEISIPSLPYFLISSSTTEIAVVAA